MSRSKEKAVALKYNVDEDMAPIVIASGYGDIARRIIDVAERQGIPVFRDDSAVSLLCMLDVGSSIPPELYEVVAAIYCQLLEISGAIMNEPAPLKEALRQGRKEAPGRPRSEGASEGEAPNGR